MTDKEKQIDEMGNIITEVAFIQSHEINGDDNLADIVAEELYDAGYRKVSDGYVVLSPEERDEEMREINADRSEREQQVRKETAKEIWQFILGLFPGDKNFTTISKSTIKAKLKEYGVEIEK